MLKHYQDTRIGVGRLNIKKHIFYDKKNKLLYSTLDSQNTLTPPRELIAPINHSHTSLPHCIQSFYYVHYNPFSKKRTRMNHEY